MNMKERNNNTEVEQGGGQKPQVFIKTIEFNDGTKLLPKDSSTEDNSTEDNSTEDNTAKEKEYRIIDHNSIVVFTGANNCGKSQVLKDIMRSLDASNKQAPIVIKTLNEKFLGQMDENTFLEKHFFPRSEKEYQLKDSDYYFHKANLQTWPKDGVGLHRELLKLFVKLLSTESRLTVSNALERNCQAQKHPIAKLNKDTELEQKLSSHFCDAFSVDLLVNRHEMQTLPLHIGQAPPDRKSWTMNQEDEYYRQVGALPKLQDQGDGMRSFASILLDAFTSDYPIMLIDEPEAFLHPPQARKLGKMLAENNSKNRQLLISTHSADFLQGLLDANNTDVTVIRIDREDDINKVSVLENDKIKDLWSNPLLRYSDILSGLFHKKVVVCESDYDCLFYQAMMDAIYENKNDIAPDILFTHCGGKGRIKFVVKALKAVNVPVVAIADFDLINKSQVFKPLLEAFGVDWEDEVHANMKLIYDSMNENKSDILTWEQIKKIGKSGLKGKASTAYKKVEKLCKSIGLFIVPVGEMECFDKTIQKEKKDWVYHVLENVDLATSEEMRDARELVQEVVDFPRESDNSAVMPEK